MMSTPDEIKALRQSMKMTQAAFAELVGVDQATISNWEKGKATPTGPAQRLLASYAANPPVVAEDAA